MGKKVLPLVALSASPSIGIALYSLSLVREKDGERSNARCHHLWRGMSLLHSMMSEALSIVIIVY